MLRNVAITALLAVVLLTGSCVYTGMGGAGSINGSIFSSEVGSPIQAVDNSVLAAGESVKDLKTGMAEATGVFGFTFGNSSITAAMEQGGITQIHHVDYKTMGVLGIYGKVTTIVYGK